MARKRSISIIILLFCNILCFTSVIEAQTTSGLIDTLSSLLSLNDVQKAILAEKLDGLILGQVLDALEKIDFNITSLQDTLDSQAQGLFNLTNIQNEILSLLEPQGFKLDTVLSEIDNIFDSFNVTWGLLGGLANQLNNLTALIPNACCNCTKNSGNILCGSLNSLSNIGNLSNLLNVTNGANLGGLLDSLNLDGLNLSGLLGGLLGGCGGSNCGLVIPLINLLLCALNTLKSILGCNTLLGL